MSHYRTITGRMIDVSVLSPKEKELLCFLIEEHGKSPEWSKFSNCWQATLNDVLMRVPPKDRPRHPLYEIAQDLEMRLGIAQGTVAEPDYRECLTDRIEEKCGTRPGTWEETLEWKARTDLGRLLTEIRAQILASGEKLLTWKEIEEERKERRGERQGGSDDVCR